MSPGLNGWLLPVDDAPGLAQQALVLARDPAQVRAAAAHARSQVAQLDWQQIARQVEDIFLRTAGWSSPPPAASPQPSLAV